VKKASEILAKILDEKSRTRGATYSSVFRAWSQMVGESLSEHSRIYEVAGGNLFVEVDHPGWMQMLLMKKNKILRSVKRNYPALDIRELRIKVNLRYAEVEETEPQNPEVGATVDPDSQEKIDKLLSSVGQDELKQRLKRLFLGSLDRERSGRGRHHG
jgi:hypothetical protein